MSDFDFSKAEAVIDPWATLNPMERFYVVIVRTKNGEAYPSLVKSIEGEESAIASVLAGLPLRSISAIKDVRAVELSELDAYAPSEIEAMVKKVLGQ